jgi:hypothetical protein
VLETLLGDVIDTLEDWVFGGDVGASLSGTMSDGGGDTTFSGTGSGASTYEIMI